MSNSEEKQVQKKKEKKNHNRKGHLHTEKKVIGFSFKILVFLKLSKNGGSNSWKFNDRQWGYIRRWKCNLKKKLLN